MQLSPTSQLAHTRGAARLAARRERRTHARGRARRGACVRSVFSCAEQAAYARASRSSLRIVSPWFGHDNERTTTRAREARGGASCNHRGRCSLPSKEVLPMGRSDCFRFVREILTAAVASGAIGLVAGCSNSAPEPAPSPPTVEPFEGTQLKDCGRITGAIQCCSASVCCISQDNDPSCIYCTNGHMNAKCLERAQP